MMWLNLGAQLTPCGGFRDLPKHNPTSLQRILVIARLQLAILVNVFMEARNSFI